MKEVDTSAAIGAIAAIAQSLAAGENVTISIFKNGAEPEFAEVDADARAEGVDKVSADAEYDPSFETFEVRAPRFNYGQMLMLRTSLEAWQAQQRNHERDNSLGDRGGARLMEFTPLSCLI